MSPRRSTDTVESLLAADRATLYGRLARWMTTASEQEIAAYWAGYRQQPDENKDITALVFLNWTRLNPQAAIAATAGGKDAHYAWWAWACHDPKNALATALATNPDRVGDVARGIGEFRPEYLRGHFKEIPEAARLEAIEGMGIWVDGENPLDSLKFMQEINHGAGPDTFEALARHDPWAALDWFRQNFARGGQGEVYLQLVVKTLAEERPEELARLAAQASSGKLKLKMEAALFDNLVKSDPAAALEQARATTTPRIAAERYAALGLDILKTDPDQARQFARDLFTACPDALQMSTKMDYPGGGRGSWVRLEGVNGFVEALADTQPARTLELAIELKRESAFETVSSRWAERDVASYADWLNQNPDVPFRNQGAEVIAEQLSDSGNFAEALEWRMRMKDGADGVERDLAQWKQADPELAYEWLEAADLPTDRKQKLKTMLDQRN